MFKTASTAKRIVKLKRCCISIGIFSGALEMTAAPKRLSAFEFSVNGPFPYGNPTPQFPDGKAICTGTLDFSEYYEH